MCREHKVSAFLAWLLPAGGLALAAKALPWSWTAFFLVGTAAAAARFHRGGVTPPAPSHSARPWGARFQRAAVFLLVEVPDALLGRKT